MGFLDIFNKQKTEINKERAHVNSTNEMDKWNNFCALDESFKNDTKLKPIYYLKLYGKNMINTNSEVKNRAKADFIRAILDSIKDENNYTIRCLVDYLINKYEILDNKKLIEIINDLNKDSLEKIANSHSFLTYVQMKNQISNINDNEIKKLVEPLVNVLSNKEMEYQVFTKKYSKELRDYILNVYNTMMTEKFENYKFNGNKSNIYFYGYKLIVIFNEDEENLNFGVKESNIVHMQKVKRLLNIDNELFTANCKEIIWNDEIPSYIENKFYSERTDTENKEETGKPYYIFKHEKYGDIKFYYIKDEIEIKCKALDSKKFEIIGVKDTFEDENLIQLYIKAIEKIIEIKERILVTLYNFTYEMCKSWEEKDENGNEISRDYIENHFSRIRISIWPQAENKKEGYSEDNTSISFAGDLYGKDDEYGIGLLGGHEIIVNTVNGENISCKLNG